MCHRTLQVTITLAVLATTTQADVVFVDDDAAPGGNGAGWNTAHRFLQDALQVATTEIRVAQGTYLPDRTEVQTERGDEMFVAMARRHSRQALDLEAQEFLK